MTPACLVWIARTALLFSFASTATAARRSAGLPVCQPFRSQFDVPDVPTCMQVGITLPRTLGTRLKLTAQAYTLQGCLQKAQLIWCHRTQASLSAGKNTLSTPSFRLYLLTWLARIHVPEWLRNTHPADLQSLCDSAL